MAYWLMGWALAACWGCVDQQKEVQIYRDVLGDAAATRPASAPAEEPLNLRQALRMANRHNEQLSLSGEDYLQALIDKERAFAGFLPTVNLSPSFLMLDRPETTTPSLAKTTWQQFRNALVNGAIGRLAGAATGGAVGTTPTARTLGASGAGNSTESATLGTTGAGLTGGSSSLGGAVGSSYRVRDNTIQRFSVPATVRMNVFNGFRDEAAVKAAEATIEERELLLLDLQAAVLLDVARMYYQVLRAQRQVEVLRNSLDVQEERLRDIRGRFDAGLARPLDVAQTEAQTAQTRGALVQARGDVTNARTTLAFLVGAPAVDGLLSDEFDVPDELEPLAVYQSRASESRQDLRAAGAAIDAARANVDLAVGQYYPSVTINFNTFMYDENFSNSSKWNGLVSASLPVFSAGLIEADVRTAFSQLRQALLNESLLRRQVYQDVRIAYENLQTNRTLLQNLQVQVAAASQAFHQAEQNYNVGFATNLERLTAQLQLLSAQLQMAGETYNRKVYYLELLRVIGWLREAVLDETATRPAN